MMPRRSPTTHTENLGGEACIYEWTRHEVHALNATAARVWELCDGNTSEADMAARLRDLPRPEALVALALSEFRQKWLLADEDDGPAERAGVSRRAMIRGLGLAAGLLPVVTSMVAPTPSQAQSVEPGSQTFDFTGEVHGFTVPAGVTRVTVTALGAQGGSSSSGSGGLGGAVTAAIAVTPGEILEIRVGGQPTGSTGGFNGGGDGDPFPGAGGGGASDVRQGGATLAHRVVVAGGGGGAGSPSAGGGAGGGTTGAPGNDEPASGAGGGGGGTPAAGGAGGLDDGSGGTPGGSGLLGTGGAGGAAEGGGGGGGYHGGGGGGGSGVGRGGAGGGGGSSFADPSATDVTHSQGARAGDGEVALAW